MEPGAREVSFFSSPLTVKRLSLNSQNFSGLVATVWCLSVPFSAHL